MVDRKKKDGTGKRTAKLLYPEINGAITGILLESKRNERAGIIVA